MSKLMESLVFSILGLMFFTTDVFSAEEKLIASLDPDIEIEKQALKEITDAKEKILLQEGGKLFLGRIENGTLIKEQVKEDYNSSLKAPIEELRKSIQSANDLRNVYQRKLDKLQKWYYILYGAGGAVTTLGAIASAAVTAGVGGAIAAGTGLYNTVKDDKDVKWNNVVKTCGMVIPVESQLDALCTKMHTIDSFDADKKEYERIHKVAWEVIPACKIAAAEAGKI